MIEQQYLGKLCPYAKDCPVYQGELKSEKVSTILVRNVFCNRGLTGWKNCKRYRQAKDGLEFTENATPYSGNQQIIS
jgi:hypothetical protein